MDLGKRPFQTVYRAVNCCAKSRDCDGLTEVGIHVGLGGTNQFVGIVSLAGYRTEWKGSLSFEELRECGDHDILNATHELGQLKP